MRMCETRSAVNDEYIHSSRFYELQYNPHIMSALPSTRDELQRLGAATVVALGLGFALGRRMSRRQTSRPAIQHALDALPRALQPKANPMPAVVDSVPDMLPAALPAAGLGDTGALDALAPLALDGAAQLNHPGYLAHMDPASAEVACGAALWQVATNQNLLHPDAAPAARGLERRVVHWLAPFFGMAGGHMVAGSTVANLTALWAAREVAGVRRVFASDRSHNSLRKAADMLGLQYVAVTSDPTTHTCDMAALLRREPSLGDACVVMTAGTVATGAVDSLSPRPVGADGTPCAWLHVDCAWAGPMRLSPALAGALAGVEHADSCGFSAHKWLYQPKGCALVLFREPERAHASMSYGGGYLATPTVGVVGSHPASALPLAATLLAWGATGVAQRLEADVAKVEALAALVAADDRFELWGGRRSSCGVLAWRPRPQVAEAADVRRRMRGAWVSLTVIDGETWLRSVAANPSADPELVFRAVAAAVEESRAAAKEV